MLRPTVSAFHEALSARSTADRILNVIGNYEFNAR